VVCMTGHRAAFMLKNAVAESYGLAYNRDFQVALSD
jgi:hypothetical protein